MSMKYVKLREEDGATIVPVIKDKFEEATQLKYPYYQKVKGSDRPYAICVGCDNPVVIVGFYSKNDKRIHMIAHPRHTQKSLSGLPPYNRENYDTCPYAKPQKYDISSRKNNNQDALAKAIKNLLLTKFDRIVYVLEKETGISFSYTWLKKMLDNYFAMKGHLYVGATMDNVPWIFIYLALNQTLYKRTVIKDSWIYNIIKENTRNIEFKEIEIMNYMKIEPTTKTYLNFAFLGHEIKKKDGISVEILKFHLYQDDKEIFKEDIILNTECFFNLIEYDVWNETDRSKKLLELAKEYI